jgi:hypothetical protein
MTSFRSTDFQSFVNSADTAIRQGPRADGRMRAAADRIFSALQTPSTQAEHTEATQLPVCSHLPAALAFARRQTGPAAGLAEAFAGIVPRLNWKVRAGAEKHGEQFMRGHANATIIGDEGIEIRRDVRVGVSLMAPHLQYPDHRHPPEEIYVVLSEGEWRQADNPWHAPGTGGLVYNQPNILHAMRSMEQPLLAIWFLWTEADAT